MDPCARRGSVARATFERNLTQIGDVMSNGQSIALLFLCTLSVSYLARTNSLSESQNAQLFKSTGELKSQRSVVVLFFSLASFATLMAFLVDHHRAGVQTWPLALIGLLGTVVVLFRSFFGVRLAPSGVLFGWRCRRQVAYTEISELIRRSDGRSTVFILVLRSSARRRIGSALACEKLFIEELQRRSGCSVNYRRPGQRVTQVH